MKKEDFGHIILFAALGIMVISGGLLTYEQIQSDKNLAKGSVDIPTEHHIDTLKFLVNPAYEYTEYCVEEKGEKPCETLSKTVISVHQGGKNLRKEDSERLRKYPSKSSLNLMLKKYSVSRSGSDTYYVTVESFDAFMEESGDEKDYTDFSTGLQGDELLRSIETCDTERLIEKTCRESRPI